MKKTYLVYKQVNGIKQLVVASQEEWDAILKENRKVPAEKRRRFIKDCVEAGEDLDCMYIEVPASEHQTWNSRNTLLQRKRKVGELYKQVSFDSDIPGTDVESLHESVPSNVDLEGSAVDNILMEELREALRRWKPWAEELLDLYLSGRKRFCTEELCQKYGLSSRAVRKRKTAFEKFVLTFFKK